MPAKRPKVYKFDAYKKSQFIERILEGHTITSACENVDITRQTYYNTMDSDPKFREKVQAARDRLTEVVEDSLYYEAVKGNVTAQIFWLCNRRRDKWQSVSRIEIDNVTDLRERIRSLPDAEFKRLLGPRPMGPNKPSKNG